MRDRQCDVTHLSDTVVRLTDGQGCPALEGVGRLRGSWVELGQRAEELEAQRGEDMQHSGEYQESVAAVEELFHQVSREWDYLARWAFPPVSLCLPPLGGRRPGRRPWL